MLSVCCTLVKMKVVLVLSLIIAAVAALPRQDDSFGRIVGGETTTIDQYPYGAALLSSLTGTLHIQSCGGTIVNNRSILTAAHCFIINRWVFQWRARVGSTFRSFGGTVLTAAQIIRHPNFSIITNDNDFAILRVEENIVFGSTIASASIAGPNYNVADNQPVWAIGWGTTCFGTCSSSAQLRHVQIYAVNWEICRQRYAELGLTVTSSMICSGVLDVGGRDQCQGDSGGPLIHNNVIVGVCSWGYQCAQPYYPGVNARVASASDWIVANG